MANYSNMFMRESKGTVVPWFVISVEPTVNFIIFSRVEIRKVLKHFKLFRTVIIFIYYLPYCLKLRPWHLFLSSEF